MVEILIYSISIYSLCNMVVFTDGPFDIFKKLKSWGYAIHEKVYYALTCMICLPIYIGAFLSLISIIIPSFYSFTPMSIICGNEINCMFKLIFDSLFTSGVVWLIHSIQTFFESNSKQDDDENNKGLLND